MSVNALTVLIKIRNDLLISKGFILHWILFHFRLNIILGNAEYLLLVLCFCAFTSELYKICRSNRVKKMFLKISQNSQRYGNLCQGIFSNIVGGLHFRWLLQNLMDNNYCFEWKYCPSRWTRSQFNKVS